MRFELLAPTHYELLKPFFEQQPYRLSVFALALVVAWRNEDGFQVRFAISDDTLYMAARHPERPSEDYLALPLPTDRQDPAALARLAENLGIGRYNFVPYAYLEKHTSELVEQYFEVTEQSGFTDYIYRARDLAQLAGHRYAKKRNLIRQFERDYVRQNQVDVEEVTPANLPECRDFVTRWYVKRNGSQDERAEIQDDERAAHSTIEEFVRLELTGIVVRVEGDICGMGTCAKLTGDMGVLNLEMAFSEFKGLYQYLDRECARRLFLNRFKYINKESDMGLPGLRQAKRSYHPILRSRCYRLAVRPA